MIPAAPTYEVRPTDYFTPLTLSGLFSAPQPVEIDLGCGEGAFLVELARRNPTRNFLGVERQFGRVRKVSRRATRQQLTNLRLIRVESDFFVRQLLAPASVARLYLLFADPWPKKRHHDRRIVQLSFLSNCARTLVEEGELCIKTDHREYFEHMQEIASASPDFAVLPWEEEMPLTDFESRFLKLGLPIYRMKLRKHRGKADR